MGFASFRMSLVLILKSKNLGSGNIQEHCRRPDPSLDSRCDDSCFERAPLAVPANLFQVRDALEAESARNLMPCFLCLLAGPRTLSSIKYSLFPLTATMNDMQLSGVEKLSAKPFLGLQISNNAVFRLDNHEPPLLLTEGSGAVWFRTKISSATPLEALLEPFDVQQLLPQGSVLPQELQQGLSSLLRSLRWYEWALSQHLVNVAELVPGDDVEETRPGHPVVCLRAFLGRIAGQCAFQLDLVMLDIRVLHKRSETVLSFTPTITLSASMRKNRP